MKTNNRILLFIVIVMLLSISSCGSSASETRAPVIETETTVSATPAPIVETEVPINDTVVPVDDAKHIQEGLVQNYHPSDSSVTPYTLSDAQQAFVDDYGSPDRFTIFFFDETLPDGQTYAVRHENWYYDARGYEVVFRNGDKFTERIGDPIQIDGLGSTFYSPQSFTAEMDLDALLNIRGETGYFSQNIDDDLMTGDLIFIQGLVAGFEDGHLSYVETVPLEEPTQPPTTDLSSFEDFIVEQGYGWVTDYWLNPDLARSDEPIKHFDEIYHVDVDTPYAMTHAFMEREGYESLGDWLFKRGYTGKKYTGIEDMVVLFGYELTYYNQGELFRLSDLAESHNMSPSDIIDVWDVDDTGTILGVLNTHGYTHTDEWLDDVEKAF